MTRKKKPIITGLALVLALLMVLGMSSSAGLIALAEGPVDELALEELELIEEAPESGELYALDVEEEPEPVGYNGDGEEAVENEETETAGKDQEETGDPEVQGTFDDEEPADENNEPAGEEILAVEEPEEASGEEEASFMSQVAMSSTLPNSLLWGGQGSDSLRCDKEGEGEEGQRPPEGWMHWVAGGATPQPGITAAELVLVSNGNELGRFQPSTTLPSTNVQFFTPYFDIFDEEYNRILEATLYYDGPEPANFVLSDYCPGQQDATLDVNVNLDYEWSVDWDWDIEKSVFPASWDLFKGDTGTSEYTVVVTRGEDVEESSLSGDFCVENIGSVDAENVVVTLDLYENDTLLAAEQKIFYLGDIPAGAAPECMDFAYDIALIDGALYKVVMSVTLDNGGPYVEEDSVTAMMDVLGIDAVTVTDSWAGTLATGLTASETFTYTRTFACDSHEEDDDAFNMNGSWRYPNTAEILETGDSDDAHVDVYCYELEIEKDAETSFDREHEWDIDKEVVTENNFTVDEDTPKVWLFIDGRYDETATWEICVTYLGFEDSDWAVSGTISIFNPSPLDALIISVEDVISAAGLDDIAADIDFGDVVFPYTLEAGETLDLDYSADLPDGADRENVATAVQQNFDYTYDVYSAEGALQATASGTTEYSAEADVTFGDDPENEYLAVINIQDVSDFDFFGTQNFGPLDAANFEAGDYECFDYEYFFTYGEYDGPAIINNTATIVETGQFASAVLKINTQDFIYESAWAKGDSNVPFCDYFSNWGWTNPVQPGTYEMDLWAGAGQCDTSKGTLVGSVTVVYDADGNVNVTYNVDPPYSLEEYHVYAGTTMFPQLQRGRSGRTVDTVAPGQYYNNSPFDGGEQVYVIAHGVVGLPDPDFGF